MRRARVGGRVGCEASLAVLGLPVVVLCLLSPGRQPSALLGGAGGGTDRRLEMASLTEVVVTSPIRPDFVTDSETRLASDLTYFLLKYEV